MSAAQQESFGAAHPQYELTSELARLSLPQTFRDSNKALAWVDSILLLFVIVGLVGIYQPSIFVRSIERPTEIVPVVFTPPDEPPPPTMQQPEEIPDLKPNEVVDQPVVATVVAPANADVAFSVPVKGATLVAASARFATPPPPGNRVVSTPQPTTFNYKAAGANGRFPDPSYPRQFLQSRQQGRILLYVVVDAGGVPGVVEVRDSSGYPQLDRHGADWVKENWRWLPGEMRYYLVPLVFQIR